MKALRSVIVLLLLCLVVPGGASTAAATRLQEQQRVPTLVGIRAAHRPGFDRVVFHFRAGLPSDVHVAWVDQLIADGSGEPVRVAGRRVLEVRMQPAKAHDTGGQTAPRRMTFLLPNVMTAVRAGDFESVTTYGLGVAKRTRVEVFTLRDPARVVLDVRAAFPTVQRRVYFFNRTRYRENREPFFTPVLRSVPSATPAIGTMDRLFAGLLPAERASGLRLLRSEATGFDQLSIEDGIARIHLTGGCSSGGSTETIAGEIMPTLRQFASVDWVKIYDPEGQTADPDGPTDSIPECLNP